MFNKISPLLIEHDKLPHYVLDALKFLYIAPTYSEANPIKVPADEKIKSYFVERWSELVSQRQSSGTKNFSIVDVPIADGKTYQIAFKNNSPVEDNWSLGYGYSENRKYEIIREHIYPIVNNSFMADPVGSSEYYENVKEGALLPSRLDWHWIKKILEPIYKQS